MPKKDLSAQAAKVAAGTAATTARTVDRYLASEPPQIYNPRVMTRRVKAPDKTSIFYKYASNINVPEVERKTAAMNIVIQPSLKESFRAFCTANGFSIAEGVAAAIRCFMELAEQATEEGDATK